MVKNKAKLYLIPTTLGECNPLDVLPISVKVTIESLDYFIVENEKTARRFIKQIVPEKSQSSLKLFLLNKHTNLNEIESYLDVCSKGTSVGLISEAGVPAIADPGADIVKIAHRKNIQVVPLVGPSSLLLAMMASGLNGQNFAFNGYLPIDSSERKMALKNLEKKSKELNQSQLFIETPYRNNKMFADLCSTLSLNTALCIATDITLQTEFIKTLKISDWKSEKIELHKRPTIFIIQAT